MRATDRPSGERARGFTFVELMVVLAILAFAFAYGVIHLDGATGAARLSASARQVGTTIEFLRGHAIQANRDLELHIDLDHNRWRMVLPPRPSEREADRREQEDVLYTEDVMLPESVDFDAILLDATDARTTGEIVITFSPLGEIVPNGFLIRLASEEVRSSNEEDAFFSIEVNGLTGEISYLPGRPAFEQVIRGNAF